jgi:hypothetical protein
MKQMYGPSGPFKKALRTFATGDPIPLLVGALGETNRERNKIVVMRSQLVARGYVAALRCIV